MSRSIVSPSSRSLLCDRSFSISSHCSAIFLACSSSRASRVSTRLWRVRVEAELVGRDFRGPDPVRIDQFGLESSKQDWPVSKPASAAFRLSRKAGRGRDEVAPGEMRLRRVPCEGLSIAAKRTSCTEKANDRLSGEVVDFDPNAKRRL